MALLTTTLTLAVAYAVMLAGILVVPLGLPGEFAIPAIVLVLRVLPWAPEPSWTLIAGLFAICVVAELLEFAAGLLGADRAGGSIRAGIGSVVGGVLGAVAGAPFGLLIGSVVGALAGTFLGAYLLEYHVTRDSGRAGRTAKGALVGRLAGTGIKVLAGIVMVLLVTVSLLQQHAGAVQ
jgi:uncharacterized protein YqgC (DUF456 family)